MIHLPWYTEPPTHGFFNNPTLPMEYQNHPVLNCESKATAVVYQMAYPWHTELLPMVYWTSYPWYIEPYTHGILTPYPYWPPPPPTNGILNFLHMEYSKPLLDYWLTSHKILNPLPMAFWPPTHGIWNPLTVTGYSSSHGILNPLPMVYWIP